MEFDVRIGDTHLGTMESSDIKLERKTEYRYITNGSNVRMHGYIDNISHIIDLEDVEGAENIDKDRYYNLVAKGYKIPRGVKLPKKKRLRKKVMKRYEYTIVVENCKIA